MFMKHQLIKCQPRTLGQGGDTIVEVMIALAILGLAIGISYATANRSLLAAREAQENTIATGLVESQIEILRTMVDTAALPSMNIFQPGPYCLSQTPPSPTYTVYYPILDKTKCTQQGMYYIDIAYKAGPPIGADIFTVTATWDNVQGDGSDTAVLEYRLHP